MRQKVDQEYYDWLVKQIHDFQGYNGLFSILHDREFVWTIDKDDNRVHDATDLRGYFLSGYPRDSNHSTYPFQPFVSVLEVIIGISRRLAFVAGGDDRVWARQLIENLGLGDFRDPLTSFQKRVINNTLDTLIWRQYEPNGHGGFFPLNRPREDQTKIEIWHQLNEYVNELNTSV